MRGTVKPDRDRHYLTHAVPSLYGLWLRPWGTMEKIDILRYLDQYGDYCVISYAGLQTMFGQR